MRIVSWNVNGLQTTLKDATHRFSDVSIYFTTILRADIVCFQEAKIQEEKLEKWMACVPGFESFWAFSQAKRGYSGVVTYVKSDLSPLHAVADKLPGDINVIEDLCREGRIMETDHGSFVLVNVYVPNAGDGEEGRPRLDFKIRFLQALRQKCDELVSSGRHVVVVGDFNIAHKAVDVHEKWNIEEIYSSEEHAWLDSFLSEYVDLFRHFHPDVKGVYSVWNAKTDARIHNEGLRIDYAVCDKSFLSQVKDTQILKMVPKNWSDHAAVFLTLHEQPALPPHPSPSISSHNMKRFQEDRRQKKLTSLFSRGASKPMSASNVDGTLLNKKGSPQEGKTSTLCPGTTNSGDLGPNTPSGVVDKLDHSAQRTKEVISPYTETPIVEQEGSPMTNDDTSGETVREASTSNKKLGGLFSSTSRPTTIANDFDSIQTLKQNGVRFEQPESDGLTVSAKCGEGIVDSPNSRNETPLSVAGLGPELNVADTPGMSPLKRKLPSTPLIKAGGVAGKQRNLASYFKVGARDSEASADEQSK